jgi:translation initiation factor 2 alpha subunit (eIF-2alpha)
MIDQSTLNQTFICLGAVEMFRNIQKHQFEEIYITTPPMIFPVDTLVDGIDDIKDRLNKICDKIEAPAYAEIIRTQVRTLESVRYNIDNYAGKADFDWESLQQNISLCLDNIERILKSIE